MSTVKRQDMCENLNTLICVQCMMFRGCIGKASLIDMEEVYCLDSYLSWLEGYDDFVDLWSRAEGSVPA